MRPLSYGIVAGCVALATGLGGESRAGTLTLSYTASITSNNLAYTPLGTGSGHVTPTAVTGSHAAVADSAPSLSPAGDVVGGITFTYSGGGLPNGYIVTGTVDLLITVKVGPDTGSFTLRETFANLVSSAGVPPAPRSSPRGRSDHRLPPGRHQRHGHGHDEERTRSAGAGRIRVRRHPRARIDPSSKHRLRRDFAGPAGPDAAPAHLQPILTPLRRPETAIPTCSPPRLPSTASSGSSGAARRAARGEERPVGQEPGALEPPAADGQLPQRGPLATPVDAVGDADGLGVGGPPEDGDRAGDLVIADRPRSADFREIGHGPLALAMQRPDVHESSLLYAFLMHGTMLTVAVTTFADSPVRPRGRGRRPGHPAMGRMTSRPDRGDVAPVHPRRSSDDEDIRRWTPCPDSRSPTMTTRATARRQVVARFARDLARWLVRHAGPESLVVHHHPNGEFTLEVELPMRPCFGRMRPAKVRVIVTDYAAE